MTALLIPLAPRRPGLARLADLVARASGSAAGHRVVDLVCRASAHLAPLGLGPEVDAIGEARTLPEALIACRRAVDHATGAKRALVSQCARGQRPATWGLDLLEALAGVLAAAAAEGEG